MPQKTIGVAGVRNVGTATPNVFDATGGEAIACVSISATNAGGFFCAPFYLPDDCDPSYPIDLYQLIRNPVTLATTGRVIVFVPVISYLNPTEAPAKIIPPINWLSPDNWPAGEVAEIKFVDDSTPDEPSIPGGTLKQFALIGIRSYRNSIDAADTFPHSITMPYTVKMIYHRRCQKLCC